MHLLIHENTQEEYCFSSNVIVVVVTVICLSFVYLVFSGII